MSALTPVSEAIIYLLRHFSVLDMQHVHLQHAFGRTLAEPMHATLPLPPFDASSVDGFALRLNDVGAASEDTPMPLRVVADIPAGNVPSCKLHAGHAARIMTGAMLPIGADAVVMIEDTDYGLRSAGAPLPEQVHVLRSVLSGDNIRPSGSDMRVGDQALAANQALRPQDLGMLAMLGVAEIPVIRRPRVAIVASGDELIAPGAHLSPGQIYDSNSHMLRALLEDGGAKPLDLGIITDGLNSVRRCLDSAIADGVDLFISTGGVSVGAYDFVRAILETEGQLKLWRVNMRPGKPLAFGQYRGVPFIGLPGNPVSAYVSFQIFVQPVLRKMLGLPHTERVVRKAQLLDSISSDGRESYLRAVAKFENNGWGVHLTGHQGSGNLHSLVQANVLLVIPAGVTSLPAGSGVDVWFYSSAQHTP